MCFCSARLLVDAVALLLAAVKLEAAAAVAAAMRLKEHREQQGETEDGADGGCQCHTPQHIPA